MIHTASGRRAQPRLFPCDGAGVSWSGGPAPVVRSDSMAHLFIKEMTAGQSLTDFFLVRSRRKRTTRAGKLFLELTLVDRTGSIDAKVWDDAEELWSECARGEVVKVQAQVEQWQDRIQLKVLRLRQAREDDVYDRVDLVPATDQDVQGLIEQVRAVVDTMEQPQLKQLLTLMFEDEPFLAALSRSAAARSIHHGYQGGLLEHIVALLKMSAFIADDVYSGLDRDLLIAASILVDIGKIEELDSSSEVSFTRAGFLLGHIFLGTQILDRYAAQVSDFPEELLLHLEHIILAHHGVKEWGSPVLPQTPEALVIHHLDNLDAKTNMAMQALENDTHIGEEFTAFHPVLHRHFYKVRPDSSGEGESEES